MSFGEFIPTPNSKLVLHLNGSSVDSSGNGLNGTDSTITYGKQYGKFNEGALFNGSSSKITLPASTVLDLHTFSHTVIFWINLTSNPVSGPCGLVGKGSYAASKTYYITRISTTGKVQHLISSNVDAQYDYFSSTDSLTTGVSNCIIFTWDKPNRLIKYYLNGSLKAGTMATAGATLPVYQESIVAYIGAVNLGSFGFFNGSMDEPIFESGIWTPQQIQKYVTNAKGWF